MVHQYFSVEQVKKFTDYDRTHYVAGLVDAISYVTSKGAIGPEVSRCLDEAESTTLVFHETVFEEAMKNASPNDPVAGVYMRLIRDLCRPFLQ
ncbi:MAG: hypothetical protein CMM61_09735 [Rhodospirillaceae bacterium]|nr:hypothetical protein [Rhodospirillaceae bacterium]